jgi:hypothetical protein
MRRRSCTGPRGGRSGTASPRNAIANVARPNWPGDVGVNPGRCSITVERRGRSAIPPTTKYGPLSRRPSRGSAVASAPGRCERGACGPASRSYSRTWRSKSLPHTRPSPSRSIRSCAPCGRCGGGPSRRAAPGTTCSPARPRPVRRTPPTPRPLSRAPSPGSYTPWRGTGSPARPRAGRRVGPAGRCAAASTPRRRPTTAPRGRRDTRRW